MTSWRCDTVNFHAGIAAAVTSAIAAKIAPENTETLLRVIQLYEQRAGRTHEPVTPPHTTGILLTRHRKAPYTIFSAGEQRVFAALGSSRDTLLVVDAGGGVLGVEKLSPVASREKDRQDLLAPVRHAAVAALDHLPPQGRRETGRRRGHPAVCRAASAVCETGRCLTWPAAQSDRSGRGPRQRHNQT